MRRQSKEVNQTVNEPRVQGKSPGRRHKVGGASTSRGAGCHPDYECVPLALNCPHQHVDELLEGQDEAHKSGSVVTQVCVPKRMRGEGR